MIKFKEFDVGDNNYEEQLEQFQTEHPTAEFVQITGGYTSYEKIWFKYEPSDISSDTDELSVEKLQEIRVEELKDFNSKILQAELKNQKLQEQLNTAKNALAEIRANIEEHNQIYDLSVDTALLLEGIDGIAFDALAAIGGDDE